MSEILKLAGTAEAVRTGDEISDRWLDQQLGKEYERAEMLAL